MVYDKTREFHKKRGDVLRRKRYSLTPPLISENATCQRLTSMLPQPLVARADIKL